MDKREFAFRNPDMIGEGLLAKYSVLVPLVRSSEGTSLIFERRSGKLRRQPGEICFPGGKLEPDETPLSCAVRETAEELIVAHRQIEILGPGDIFVSPFNFVIYPFIGEITDYHKTYNTAEVSEIITVPVDFFLTSNPDTYKSTLISQLPQDFPYGRIPGGEKYKWATGTHEVLFYQYDHHLIWGITAHIVQSAVALIDQHQLLSESSG